MQINELAASGYAVATVAFAILATLLLTLWKDRPKSGLFAIASAATAIWACVQIVGSLRDLGDTTVLFIIEWIRDLSWLIVLASVLRDLDPRQHVEKLVVRYGLLFLLAAALLIAYYWIRTADSLSMIAVVAGGLVLSAVNLFFAEQIYRNAPIDGRSSLKYFCVGIAGISAYDFYIFSWTVVDTEMNINHWAARGYVYALFALPLGFAARRPFQLSLDSHVPRQIVFYSFVAICAGFFVTFLLLSDYYIRTLGGTWGGAIRIVLFVAAFMVAAVVTVSATVRARIRVFLTKSFFQYKYDYRKEWLRFIGTLSGSELDNVANTAVRAIAQIVNSPGGIACVQEEEDVYTPIGAWGSSLPEIPAVPKDASLIRFLKRRQWVIDLQEMRDDPARYDGLDLDGAFSDESDWWLIVPMFLGERLLGFIMLQRPRVVPSLNFEDHDLLKTVGRHAATHIDQAEADKRLAESRQFGTYNRLTAFLMHDLNNLIAQQSLVVKNAEKYRHNPKFVDDAIDTIANSVTRMRRLMEQLTNTSAQSGKRKIRLNDVVSKAAKRTSLGAPNPELKGAGEDVFIEADPDRLAAIVENLIRNAQDATSNDGEIVVDLEPVGQMAIVRIRDNGCGMTSDFIRERLFRPFDSTKGSESMGIGAYQAREYVRQIGGQLSVTSEVGRGTTFNIELPQVRGR